MIIRLRLIGLLFCIFLLQQAPLHAQTNILRFKRVTSQQGLSENGVTAVMQDDNGRLWVANKIAINSFDGETAKVYHVGQNNNINQFFEDKNRNIWAATQHGIYVFDKNKDSFVKLKSNHKKRNKLFASNVFCIVSTKQNELLISGANDFLVKLKIDRKARVIDSSIQFLNKPKKYGNLTKIVKGPDATFWLATDRGEVLIMKNDVISESAFVKSGNGLLINDLAMDNFGNLWVATNGNGLFRYNIDNKTTKHFYKEDNAPQQSINNNIVTKLYAEGKNLWIGTDGGGLNLYAQDKEVFNYYTYDFGNEFSISDNSIIDIQPGLNNVILLGTVHGGISMFRNNYKIQNVPAKNLKFLTQDPQGSRVMEDSYKNIWLSAGRTGLRRYNPKTKSLTIFSAKGSDSGFRGNIVLSLFEDNNKRIWVGTLREGVNIYDLKQDRFIDFKQGKDFKGVFSITHDEQGNIWVGHRKGISIFNKDLKLIQLLTKQSSNSNQIICLYKDTKGNMWVGTTDGLFKYEKKDKGFVMRTYKHKDKEVNSLSSSSILSIGESQDSSILVGTYGHGLNKYVKETGKFERLASGNKIKGGIIRGILKDHQKNIWLSTNAGLTKMDSKGEITNYGITEGIFPFNGGAASLDSSGKILMAGVFGLSYFKPDKLQFKNYCPPVYFTSIKAVNGEKESIYSFSEFANDTVVVKPDTKLLNINFASSELYSKNSIEYQFLMVGLDDNWQNLGGQNKISFSNLDPGKYQLRVRATNNSKLWDSKYTTLYIIVKPSFWQRPLVRGLLLLVVISMFVVVYRLRTSVIEKQKIKLQKMLDLKTIEVKEQEQRISQSKISMLEIEKQNQGLRQKKLQDELNFKINELTNNSLRSMHKNNLLNDIKDKLKTELKSKTIDRNNLEAIVDHINDSFILDADWESFYTLFNQVHPTFIKELKRQYPALSEREIRLCTLILIDFSSQHMATLFGISLTSIKVARHRLRKKLNIPTGESVKNFMLDLAADELK